VPDARGNIRGIALSGKAGDTLDRIFGRAKDDFSDVWRKVIDSALPSDTPRECECVRWVQTSEYHAPYCPDCLRLRDAD
jgi:uracil-DNA glycosylase